LATKIDEKGEPIFIKPYKKGDYFGELALLKGGPRAANVIAKVFSNFNFFNLFKFNK
jgi:CRP-like cAMP-binding protein